MVNIVYINIFSPFIQCEENPTSLVMKYLRVTPSKENIFSQL